MDYFLVKTVTKR